MTCVWPPLYYTDNNSNQLYNSACLNVQILVIFMILKLAFQHKICMLQTHEVYYNTTKCNILLGDYISSKILHTICAGTIGTGIVILLI